MATARSGGGLWAALPPGLRRLTIEAAAIVGVIALGAFLVYHFTVHTIRNTRPLGGRNVEVAKELGDQTETAFAIDPSRPRVVVGAFEALEVYSSADGGRTWERGVSPTLPGRTCAVGRPRVVIGPGGREYLTFLSGSFCGDSLTPHVAVTSRAGPAGRWGPVTRVAPRTWKYGFDDAPDLALDRRSGRLYLAWTRSLSSTLATVVVSSSADDGRTWSAPRAVSRTLTHPHLASIAAPGDGAVYVTGIDAKRGLWIARSGDGGRTFGRPRTAAPLRANPSPDCALTAIPSVSPLPNEEQTCTGPNPTVLARGDRVFVVYDDVGDNGSPDVSIAAFDRGLKPLFRATVSPPDRGKAQQFLPTAAVDSTTGVLWGCWYDTTFDRRAHRAWFTCSASHDGRSWTPPERAADQPIAPTDLFGVRLGIFPSVVARDGVAHAFWPDGRVIDEGLNVFTASLRERSAFRQGSGSG